MTLFGIAIGLLELGLIAVFLIAMVISVSVDRRGVPHPKWIVTLLGIGGVLFLTRDSWTLSSLGDFVLSATFWVPLLKYLGAGLAYSFVEFARETRLRRAAVSVKGEFTTRHAKEILATNVGAWSMFWPFYLMSLIVGDLLAEVFNAVAAVIVSMSGRFVKAVFKDTFKL